MSWFAFRFATVPSISFDRNGQTELVGQAHPTQLLTSKQVLSKIVLGQRTKRGIRESQTGEFFRSSPGTVFSQIQQCIEGADVI